MYDSYTWVLDSYTMDLDGIDNSQSVYTDYYLVHVSMIANLMQIAQHGIPNTFIDQSKIHNELYWRIQR